MDLHRDTIYKIEMAAKMYDSMSDDQREAIGPYVSEIIDIQRRINKVAVELHADIMCKKCEGSCCTDGIEYGLEVEEFLYAMFRITNEERRKIYEVLERKHEGIKCSFLAEEGCALPSTARPIHCKSFYCVMTPGVEVITKNDRKNLKDAYFKYVQKLDEIYFL